MIVQKRQRSDVLIDIGIYTLFFIIALLCAYPFYYIFINTISSNTLSEKGKIIFLPSEMHLSNYVSAFKIPGLLEAAYVSIARTVIGTTLTVAASGFLGYMFSRKTLWHRRFWYRLVIATMYFNAGIIPWYLTMRNLGLVNNFLGYILPAIVSPFNVILAKTYVESTPIELQEAAEIDGAGTLKIFYKVVMPLMKPILATIAIFSAVGQWNSFQDTLLLMTDSGLYTLQYILYQYINQASSLANLITNTTDTNQISQLLANTQTSTSVRMTVTIIVITPIILVYPFFQRFFTKGIMIGAIKG